MTPDEYDFHTEPMAHQLRIFLQSADRPAWAFFDEMGTGKSKLVIDTAAYLYQADQIDGLLIVAPKGCYRNWVGEIETHLGRIECWTTFVWGGKKRNLIADSALSIFIINTEAFQSGQRGIVAAYDFLKLHRSLFVIDESTAIKNRTAKRTKALVNLGGMAPFRRILTGTPVTNTPEDLYSQCAFLDPKLLGHTSYYSFRARYCETEDRYVGRPRPVKVVTGHKNIDELAAKLRTFSSRTLKSEALDLPPKVYQRREVELTKEQGLVYEALRSHARAELEGKEVTVTMALTQILRLHQIVCGFVKADDDTLRPIPENRTQALFDVIDEASGKVLVWCNFVYNVEAVKRALLDRYGPESTLSYYGASTTQERDEARVRFQDDPSCRFFVGTPSTAGYGLTLTAASTVVYYSNSFKLEQRLQSEDRSHRKGTKHSVTYVDLVAPGTIDERIVQTLRDKKEIAALVIDGGWREML